MGNVIVGLDKKTRKNNKKGIEDTSEAYKNQSKNCKEAMREKKKKKKKRKKKKSAVYDNLKRYLQLLVHYLIILGIVAHFGHLHYWISSVVNQHDNRSNMDSSNLVIRHYHQEKCHCMVNT